MKIAIVSDAWHPQVNGVVTTLADLLDTLRGRGHRVELIEPSQFRRVPLPGYREIGLSVLPRRRVARLLDDFDPDALHIATEGPLGHAARAHAIERGWAFTTAFHTRFPEFVQAATGCPAAIGYAWLRRFHAAASGTLVPSDGMLSILRRRGYTNLRAWSHGIDTTRFSPRPPSPHGWKRPVFLSVGRISAEKNLEAFLELELPGSKVVAGGGPKLRQLKQQHPDVHWLGPMAREALPALYSAADVFVHPSRTDTFGLVMLEAMACGTPVAAYPVAGPLDVVGDGRDGTSAGGVLHADLWIAAVRAVTVPRATARARACAFSCDDAGRVFLSHLVPIERRTAGARTVREVRTA